jgi:hypothetical protein
MVEKQTMGWSVVREIIGCVPKSLHLMTNVRINIQPGNGIESRYRHSLHIGRSIREVQNRLKG